MNLFAKHPFFATMVVAVLGVGFLFHPTNLQTQVKQSPIEIFATPIEIDAGQCNFTLALLSDPAKCLSAKSGEIARFSFPNKFDINNLQQNLPNSYDWSLIESTNITFSSREEDAPCLDLDNSTIEVSSLSPSASCSGTYCYSTWGSWRGYSCNGCTRIEYYDRFDWYKPSGSSSCSCSTYVPFGIRVTIPYGCCGSANPEQ